MSLSNKGNAEQARAAIHRMMNDEDAYFSAAPIVWDALSSGQRETLNQLLFKGPVFDGDIVSKSCRDDLIDLGLAVRCCFRGEAGYAAATYAGKVVFDSSKAIAVSLPPTSTGVVKSILKWAEDHYNTVCDGHNPDVPGTDLVEHGYGNAMINVIAYLKSKVGVVSRER